MPRSPKANIQIGKRIRSWCVDKGITNKELAEAIGVKESTLRSCIYGDNGLDINRAIAIADFFGKSLDELACRTDYTIQS